jgi:hypothetical protein
MPPSETTILPDSTKLVVQRITGHIIIMGQHWLLFLPIYGLDLTYPNGTGFPYGTQVGLTVGDVLPDANLKPEFVTSKEIGGEFRLLNRRITLDVTAYDQNSKDQILQGIQTYY